MISSVVRTGACVHDRSRVRTSPRTPVRAPAAVGRAVRSDHHSSGRVRAEATASAPNDQCQLAADAMNAPIGTPSTWPMAKLPIPPPTAVPRACSGAVAAIHDQIAGPDMATPSPATPRTTASTVKSELIAATALPTAKTSVPPTTITRAPVLA